MIIEKSLAQLKDDLKSRLIAEHHHRCSGRAAGEKDAAEL